MPLLAFECLQLLRAMYYLMLFVTGDVVGLLSVVLAGGGALLCTWSCSSGLPRR